MFLIPNLFNGTYYCFNGCDFRHLHALSIYHGDLKLENILLTIELDVKVADLGLARAEYKIMTTGTASNTLSSTQKDYGTAEYSAPELIVAGELKKRTAHTDAYA